MKAGVQRERERRRKREEGEDVWKRKKKEREIVRRETIDGTKRECSLDTRSRPLLVIYDSELARTGVDPWLPTNGWE